jgi:hypothetical protein
MECNALPADLLGAGANSETEEGEIPPKGQSQADVGIGVLQDKAFIEFQAQRANAGGEAVFGGCVLLFVIAGQAAEKQAGNEVIYEMGYSVGEHGESSYGVGGEWE